MFKDKPSQYMGISQVSKRQRSYYLVSIVMSLLLLSAYFELFSTSSIQSQAYPNHLVNVDWSRFAYSQYATDQDYLCSSLMVFDSLEKLGSKADRLLFYPKTWDLKVSSTKDRISQLLVMARDKYKVKLHPTDMYKVERPHADQSETTWDASINKLYAFKHGEYQRIIHLDSDITLLKTLDDLFFLPATTVAMPRAYWKLDQPIHQGGGHKLSSLLVVLQPSEPEANELWSMATGLINTESTPPSPPVIDPSLNRNPPSEDDEDANDHSTRLFDMDILNARYTDTALILPHRTLALITGEFRRPGRTNHTRYLSNTHEPWDPHVALSEARLVHFSDWPVPKPWIATPQLLLREMQPACEFDSGTPMERGCDNRAIWKGLYDDFRRRRKDVCRLLSVPAPEWPPVARGRDKTGPGKG